jgi:hypothetical protein
LEDEVFTKVTDIRELSAIAQALTRNATADGLPQTEFRPAPAGTHIEHHVRIATGPTVVPIVVMKEGDQLRLYLPSGTAGCISLTVLLDPGKAHLLN